VPKYVDKTVDVFYLYPSAYRKAALSDPMIGPVDDPVRLLRREGQRRQQGQAVPRCTLKPRASVPVLPDTFRVMDDTSTSRAHVTAVPARDPRVITLLAALTAELDSSGYTPSQTFGYSVEQLERAEVHLVAAPVGDRLVGVGGVELQDGGVAELKRFYVEPEHRGTGVADALIAALVDHAAARGVEVLRLETGDKQHAAISFYRRHGFAQVPRFEPYLSSETSVCMQRDLRSPV
jgi:putative acetyltransferase